MRFQGFHLKVFKDSREVLPAYFPFPLFSGKDEASLSFFLQSGECQGLILSVSGNMREWFDRFHGAGYPVILKSSTFYHFDLGEVSGILSLLIERFGDGFSQGKRDWFLGLGYAEALSWSKVYWVLGNTPMWSSEENTQIYMLFQKMLSSKVEFLKYYYELEEEYSSSQIFYGVLSFIERVVYADQRTKVSPKYAAVILGYQRRRGQVVQKLFRFLSNREVSLNSAEFGSRLLYFLLDLV